MDLIAQGQITTNFIEPSFELVGTWNDYYHSIIPPGSKTSIAAYILKSLKNGSYYVGSKGRHCSMSVSLLLVSGHGYPIKIFLTWWQKVIACYV